MRRLDGEKKPMLISCLVMSMNQMKILSIFFLFSFARQSRATTGLMRLIIVQFSPYCFSIIIVRIHSLSLSLSRYVFSYANNRINHFRIHQDRLKRYSIRIKLHRTHPLRFRCYSFLLREKNQRRNSHNSSFR